MRRRLGKSRTRRSRHGLTRLVNGLGCDAGMTAVEFALVAPIILGLLLGAMEMGRAGFSLAVLNRAAAQTTRWVVVNPRDVTGSESLATYKTRIETFARSKLALVSPANIVSVTATPIADAANNATEVDVQIVYDFKWTLPFVSDGKTRLTATSSGFVVRDK